MAKVRTAKIKKAKPSTQLPLDDMRWRPAAEIVEKLLPHIGNKVLIARDLTKALASKKIHCRRRSIVMGQHPLPGPRELVPASYWAEHCFACSPNGDVRAGVRTNHPGPWSFTSDTTEHKHSILERLTDEQLKAIKAGASPVDAGVIEPWITNWVFYLWQPDCVKVWPALEPREIDKRKAKPRPARRRLTRKASERVGTGLAKEAGDSVVASGSPHATDAGDMAAVAERRKRKRRGKLTAEQIEAGCAYLRDHPELKSKQAYPKLRSKLKCNVSDTTLWRAFFRKKAAARYFI